MATSTARVDSVAENESPKRKKREVERVALSVAEFAAAIGVTPMTIYRWIKLGLPNSCVGAVRRIVVTEGLAWMRAQTPPDKGEP